MIAARLESGKGEVLLLMVLEPGNIEKLKHGQPISKVLNEFFPELPTKIELALCYSPDVEWVAAELQRRNVGNDAEALARIVDESLKRRAVVDRSEFAERMKRVDV